MWWCFLNSCYRRVHTALYKWFSQKYHRLWQLNHLSWGLDVDGWLVLHLYGGWNLQQLEKSRQLRWLYTWMITEYSAYLRKSPNPFLKLTNLVSTWVAKYAFFRRGIPILWQSRTVDRPMSYALSLLVALPMQHEALKCSMTELEF